jgi:hypothetical protein
MTGSPVDGDLWILIPAEDIFHEKFVPAGRHKLSYLFDLPRKYSVRNLHVLWILHTWGVGLSGFWRPFSLFVAVKELLNFFL